MKPSPETLALAQALVDQLGADERRDMLSRWMAHDLAAKMVAAARPDADAATQAACTEAVEALWARRAEFPDGKRPFEDLEDMADALRRLDPDRTPNAYFQPAASPDAKRDPLLDAALHIDRGARVLILACLKAAAAKSGKKARKWAALAESASLSAREIVFVRSVLGEGPDPDAQRRGEIERLRSHLQLLADLRKTTAAVSADYRAQLAALGPPPPRKRTAAPAGPKPPGRSRRR